MGTPSSSLATLRPDLDGSLMEFDLIANQQGFIGHKVLPVISPAKQAGTFGKIPVEQLLKERDTYRAPSAGYSRSSFQFESVTYSCEEHGAEEPVDDRSSMMYRDYFDSEMVAAARARNAVVLNAERRIANAVFNATTWTSHTTAVTNEWDDADNATPLADVEAAVQSVWDACGIWPDTMIINRKVFRNLRNVDEVIDRIKYQGYMDARAGEITVSSLSAAFDLDIIVANSARDTANEGQDTVISPVWSDEYCMVCKTAKTNDIQEPCIGRTFHWTEDGSEIMGAMESYRDETVRSDIIRSRNDTDEVILYVESGHLLSNITS